MSSDDAKRRLRSVRERTRSIHQARHDSGIFPQLTRLESFQKDRLKLTYADFDSNPRFRPATTFFRETLYAPVDLERRDADLERMVPTMVRLLPESVLLTIVRALELQVLSMELDLQLTQSCIEAGAEMPSLGPQQYAQAFRRCDNRPVRERQIELMNQVGLELEHWVHVPFVYSTLVLCRVPAKLAGLSSLQHFLEEGFSSFRQMNGAGELLDAIEQREGAILAAIYGEAEDPFDWQAWLEPDRSESLPPAS